ncbi:MAG: hypothetical protein EAZ65_08145 [Verrucomicrobia bacterium]|nr:MAG: hypothetical protein EAZ84_11250 [Verrucomicrobiota bacterium]TAE86846.1 MAG: hypothetical protein EAZ82_09935 [Verrucomicrobiota bacterium]TAF24619.1 MAG: hypothetical protein EAZ71_10160 [Verrucomicrobiota bacterium]TAF40519.1 MAG: hypothetical protein EAZ65_08145 [Verrucomicrobiota bacterium]
MRFALSLRIEAVVKTITPTFGSMKGMTFRAETNPASFPPKLRYPSAGRLEAEGPSVRFLARRSFAA